VLRLVCNYLCHVIIHILSYFFFKNFNLWLKKSLLFLIFIIIDFYALNQMLIRVGYLVDEWYQVSYSLLVLSLGWLSSIIVDLIFNQGLFLLIIVIVGLLVVWYSAIGIISLQTYIVIDCIHYYASWSEISEVFSYNFLI